jgi:hypothetical protein
LPVVVLEIRHSRHRVRLRLVCLTLAVGNHQDSITCMLLWVILLWLSVSIVDISNTPARLRLGNNSLSTFVSTPDQHLSSGRFLTDCVLLQKTTVLSHRENRSHNGAPARPSSQLLAVLKPLSSTPRPRRFRLLASSRGLIRQLNPEHKISRDGMRPRAFHNHFIGRYLKERALMRKISPVLTRSYQCLLGRFRHCIYPGGNCAISEKPIRLISLSDMAIALVSSS